MSWAVRWGAPVVLWKISKDLCANVLLRARCKVQGIMSVITAVFATETGEVGKISR